jgi:hypothetical protein
VIDKIGTLIGTLIGAGILWLCRGFGAGIGLWIALKTTGLLP